MDWIIGYCSLVIVFFWRAMLQKSNVPRSTSSCCYTLGATVLFQRPCMHFTPLRMDAIHPCAVLQISEYFARKPPVYAIFPTFAG